MAPPNLTLIADVDVTRDDLNFKLRVINLWHQMSFYNKDEIFSIELILMDEDGNKIQATISKRNIYRFKNVLKDGMSFYIKGPNFATLKSGSFKLTPHYQKLTLVQQTVVTECNDFSGSEFGFSFVDTIEFQKRGLPHSHICLFMHADCKVPIVEYIDPIISAEIPNINDDPELYSLVKEFMIHGPCGAENLNCPCMVDRKCSKNFPKLFFNHTSVDSNGFPLYRRRDDGHFVEKSGVQLDNRNVVPYNKYLLKRYQAHINVEWCNQGSSIKYLFKYINKSPDRAIVSMERTNNDSDKNDVADEIKEYYDCRYISACEASWQIFQFDVHYRHPAVIRLPFHFPDQQHVVYEADDDIEDVLDRTSNASSMFTSWMKCNEINKEARKLTYVEFPTKFVWKRKGLFWKPRKVEYAIGRIHLVSPKLGEAYFLRILLNKVKGPKSFDEIRTVNGQLCSSFKDVCYNLGLLDDDKEFIDAIKEASLSGSGFYLRFLFATMLFSNSLCNPEIVWQNTWEYLSDGILYYQQQRLKSPDALPRC
ncbi:hypothetical protein Lser_V15G30629 [Lactuca serriola]